MQISVRYNTGLKASDIKMRSVGQQLPGDGVLTLPDFGEQMLRVVERPGLEKGRKAGGGWGTGRGPAGGASSGDPGQPHCSPSGHLNKPFIC